MTLTALQVVNRAITEIAQGPPLTGGTVASNFDASATGIYAATLYNGAVLMLLRNQDFEFCRRVVALVSTGNTPPLQWAHEYAYPLDCVRVRQVAPASWDATDPQPVRWDVGDVSVTGIIATTALGAGGSGYVVGDTGTITGGTGGTYIVTTVSGGAVTGFTVTAAGSGYAVGTAATADAGGQPGVGTGFTISILTVAFTALQVIWTDGATARLVYSTSSVTEADWDSMFTEQMVRYMGSMLAMPVAGRPDFSREMLGTAGKIGQSGLDRDS